MNGLHELSNIYDLQLLCSTDAVECHLWSSLVKLVCISTDRGRFHDMQMITSTTRSDTPKIAELARLSNNNNGECQHSARVPHGKHKTSFVFY